MEDTEIGYRLYRNGAWFNPVSDAKALHQSPQVVQMKQIVQKAGKLQKANL